MGNSIPFQNQISFVALHAYWACPTKILYTINTNIGFPNDEGGRMNVAVGIFIVDDGTLNDEIGKMNVDDGTLNDETGKMNVESSNFPLNVTYWLKKTYSFI